MSAKISLRTGSIFSRVSHCCDSRYLLDSEALQSFVHEAPPHSMWTGASLRAGSWQWLSREWSHETQQHISWGIAFLLSAYKLCAIWRAGKRERTDVWRHLVTMLTACEFIHQKVITLCSGKNLTFFFAALSGWQQIPITQFSKSTRWFAALIKRQGSWPEIPNIRQNYKSSRTKRL